MSSSSFSLSSGAVRDLFAQLLFRDVYADAKAKPTRFRARHGGTLATFKDGAGAPLGAVWCDTPLANVVGAALTMMPANSAREDTARAVISDATLENLAEVMNIGSSLFADAAEGGVVQLDSVYRAAEVPADVVDFVKARGARYEFNVDIKGYGAGVIQFAA